MEQLSPLLPFPFSSAIFFLLAPTLRFLKDKFIGRSEESRDITREIDLSCLLLTIWDLGKNNLVWRLKVEGTHNREREREREREVKNKRTSWEGESWKQACLFSFSTSLTLLLEWTGAVGCTYDQLKEHNAIIS